MVVRAADVTEPSPRATTTAEDDASVDVPLTVDSYIQAFSPVPHGERHPAAVLNATAQLGTRSGHQVSAKRHRQVRAGLLASG